MPEETLNEAWREIFGDLIPSRMEPATAHQLARSAVETHTETHKAIQALVWENSLPEDYQTTLRYRLRVERERMQAAKYLAETTEHQSGPLTRAQLETVERVGKLLAHTRQQNEAFAPIMEKHA